MSNKSDQTDDCAERKFDVQTYNQIRDLVAANNMATGDGISTELITCQIWKESGFDPNAMNGSHIGLLQLSSDAVDYTNNNTPDGVHFNYPGDLYDPAKNIQCATYYLDAWMRHNPGKTIADALNAYGTGAPYADNIIACEACIQSKSDPSDATLTKPCLDAIHV